MVDQKTMRLLALVACVGLACVGLAGAVDVVVHSSHGAGNAVAKQATKEAPSRVSTWVSADDETVALCSALVHDTNCFDGTTFLDDDADDKILDVSEFKSYAQACAKCGYGTDDEEYGGWENCVACEDGATLLVASKPGCNGLCALDEHVDFLATTYGFAPFSLSDCRAAVPCYDDDEVLATPATGWVPPFSDDDWSFSYSYRDVDVPSGCDDNVGNRLQREEETWDIAADYRRGFDLDGTFGVPSSRMIFSATGGTYVGALVTTGSTECSRLDPTWATDGCSGCSHFSDSFVDGRLTISWDAGQFDALAASMRVCSIGEETPDVTYNLFNVVELDGSNVEIYDMKGFTLDYYAKVAGSVELFTVGGKGTCVLSVGDVVYDQGDATELLNTYDGRCLYDLPAGTYFSFTNENKRATCKMNFIPATKLPEEAAVNSCSVLSAARAAAAPLAAAPFLVLLFALVA